MGRCRMGSIRKALIVLAVFSLPALPAPPAFPALPALSANPVVKGPERGALVIVGGGKVGTEILSRMFDLAGGKDAPLVVIPTANGQDEYPADWPGLKMFRDFGATDITLLHTKDRKQADSEAFVRPLMAAKLVWFVGGRQWRLVDVYAHTRTQREIERVLERDGVVAGSSAGATTPSRSSTRSISRWRSEEHTSELQSHHELVCRLLLEKKKNNIWRLLRHKTDRTTRVKSTSRRLT